MIAQRNFRMAMAVICAFGATTAHARSAHKHALLFPQKIAPQPAKFAPSCETKLFAKLVDWSTLSDGKPIYDPAIYGTRDELHHAIIDRNLKISPAAHMAAIDFMNSSNFASLPKACWAYSRKFLMEIPVIGERPVHPGRFGVVIKAAALESK